MEDKNYTIKWCEISKTGNTNGRAWQITKMTLVDPEGKETEGVSTFESVMNGGTLEGKIVTNDKGYLNFIKKLEAPAFIKQASNSAYKTQQIEKTMERKEQSIAKSQDNKEWGIKIASSMNKAVDVAIAENKDNITPEDILRWRKWIWNNWDIDLDDTDAITGKIN